MVDNLFSFSGDDAAREFIAGKGELGPARNRMELRPTVVS
jgi:hypothetical protein